MSRDELDRIKEKIRSNPELPTEWMLTQYMNQVKRSGAEARGSQANYLKALRKILVKEDIDLEKVKEMSKEELFELNKQMESNIQSSKYRKSSGGDSVRQKTQYWSSWKALLETQGWKTDKYKQYMPKTNWINDSNQKNVVTRPDEIPTREQMKQFVKNLEKKSERGTALRNKALAMLLWDKGPRIGEALSIKLKHVNVQGQLLEIKIPGNKGSDDRTVPIYQGRKILKEWIEKHPYRGNPEAFLFPSIGSDQPESQLNGNPGLSSKFHVCAHSLDFKTSGEPFHIFRKGMVSSHFINEWANWEKITKWHGKENDATKPDYLKLMLEDVSVSVGENMGVDEEAIPERSENSMQGRPLKPVKCPSCSYLNNCIQEICQSCGTELPESEMPKAGIDAEKEDVKTTVKESGGMTDQQIENLVESKIDKLKEDLIP